jgi:hypothetical protein
VTINASVVGTVADGELFNDFSLEGRAQAFSETKVRGEEVVDGCEGGAEHELIVTSVGGECKR